MGFGTRAGGSHGTRAGVSPSLLPAVWSLVAAVLLVRPAGTRADVALLSFDTADLPLRFVGAAEHYLRVNDLCGVCGGDGKTCMGCDGVPNSAFRYDACGLCGDPASVEFNATCKDCADTVHGSFITDDCGVCRDPASVAFSRAGVPDKHNGGCVGCDGIPNSGNELDACGVCAGLGCEPDDPTKRSWCCDCASTAFGTHVVDFCCACVDRASHWHLLSGGTAFGPPKAHAFAEQAWERGRTLVRQSLVATETFLGTTAAEKNAGVADGTADSNDNAYAASSEIYALGNAAFDAFAEGWSVMKDPSLSNDQSECYALVYLSNNATNPRDACGVCGGGNETCAGCDGTQPVSIPNGGGIYDDCGTCGTRNTQIDACGVCGGDNGTCVGCDGIPGSGTVFDGCLGSSDPRYLTFLGETGEPGSGCSDPSAFKLACEAGEGGCCGCDGVPNSGATRDGCGECANWATTTNKVVNYTCSGCDLVPFSVVKHDWCCECDGDSGHDNDCYHDATVFGALGPVPFDPYSDTHQDYFNDVGKARYDECGECRSVLKNGTTCLGCDGVYGSGVTHDACGVCGGDCSTCNATQTGLPFDCEQPGRGWTGMDRTCSFHRLAGASGVTDAWALWNAAPNGTDPHDGTKKLPRAETWYKRLNSADAKPFLETAVGECRQYLEPPPPATPRERREWVVFLDGAEEGPYTRLELETGSITVTELTGVSVAVPLLPATLVGKLTRSAQTQTVVYGATSRYQTRVDSWRTRMAGRFVSSAVGTEQMNVVNVDGFATKLTHWAADAESGTYASVDGGSYATGTNANTATSNAVAFLPMAVMPGMERVAYPYCTGATWRGSTHRTHGRKLPGNFLGIITSENITDAGTGLSNQAWNPLDEYISDVSTGWMDQRCQCSWEWEYQSEPIAPTCPRVWFPWSGWENDGWFVTKSVFFSDPRRYTVSSQRSLAGGGWRVSGGWWQSDFGGGGPLEYGDSGANIYNAHGSPSDFGFGAVRGPQRIDAAGTYTVVTVAPRTEDRPVDLKPYITDKTFSPATQARCYGAARVAPPLRNSAGAIWHEDRQVVNAANENASGWSTSFKFVLREPSERCKTVNTVSRSFGSEIRTLLHGQCEVTGGDGFAFVVWDAGAEEEAALSQSGVNASTGNNPGVGASGPGLGYSGLTNSLAVEFDLWHNPLNEEPYDPHIAIHTDGAFPNSAHHGARLAATTEIPTIADGETHAVRVTFLPDVGWAKVAHAIESGECKGTTARLGRFTGTNPGLLRVYVDDMDVPLLSTPLTMATFLRENSTDARVGFTASTGESWVTVDIVQWNFSSYA